MCAWAAVGGDLAIECCRWRARPTACDTRAFVCTGRYARVPLAPPRGAEVGCETFVSLQCVNDSTQGWLDGAIFTRETLPQVEGGTKNSLPPLRSRIHLRIVLIYSGGFRQMTVAGRARARARNHGGSAGGSLGPQYTRSGAANPRLRAIG